MNIAVVILAAGIGKRMVSAKHKVLHELSGRPILSYIINTANDLEPEKIVVVVGHQSDTVVKSLNKNIHPIYQDEQLGTGHAVALTKGILEDYSGPILVLPGDAPLLRPSTLARLVEKFEKENPAAAMLMAEVNNPFGYGRVILGENGVISGIVEEKDATAAQRRITMVNAGVYSFNKDKLFKALEKINAKNNQGEFFLTDVIGIFKKKGEMVIAAMTDQEEILGINSRAELAEAEAILQKDIKNRLMAAGVTFILPETSFIGIDVTIGRDTIIYPNTFLSGSTVIGEGCNIGPAANIVDSKIGAAVTVQYTVMTGAEIDDEANIGPFCSIRPDTKIKKGGKAGTFVELKSSTVGVNSKVPHLSYIGDAILGSDVNIGAGTITCNYDGVNKWETAIEDGAFLGSDTMLVAPVKIGKGAMTAAGSAISRDVPAGSLGIERSEQRNIPGWAAKHLEKAERKKRKGKTGGKQLNNRG